MEEKKPRILLKIYPFDPLDYEDELDAFSDLINLISTRDNEKTMLNVLRLILENDVAFRPISSSYLSRESNLNRLTCLHHLKRLEEFGLIENVDGRYILKKTSFSEFIEELEEESREMFAILKKLAKKIDDKYIYRRENNDKKQRKWKRIKIQ